MKKAIGEKSSPEKENCCKYKKNIVTAKSTYEKTMNLPKWIYDITRPVFDALADGELLLRCFYGEAHNPSETFNWVLIQQFYIIMKEYVVLALHFRILKLITVIICKKVASKGIKSLLEKLI